MAAKLLQFFFAFMSTAFVSSQTITMLTPFVLAKKGGSAVLIAQSSTNVASSQINWYYNGNALTVSGTVTQQTGKYVVTSNGTVFTLSINSIKSSDYGFYSLLYLNLQTIQITVLNATVAELVETIVISQCRNPNSTVAVCIILLIGYVLLIISGAVFFLIARSENGAKKTELLNISILVMGFQVATAFISAMVTLWGAFYRQIDNRNTTASILGLIAYLLSWFPIFYFFGNHAKQNKYQMLYNYILVILITLQVAMLIGVILCISHCTNNITLPSIDVDYGMLGVLFSVIALIISCIIALFAILYFKSEVFKELILTIFVKESDRVRHSDKNDPSAEAKNESEVVENDVNEKEPKKSLKAKLKNKLKSMKSNKIQNEGKKGKSKEAKESNGKSETAITKQNSPNASPSPMLKPATQNPPPSTQNLQTTTLQQNNNNLSPEPLGGNSHQNGGVSFNSQLMDEPNQI